MNRLSCVLAILWHGLWAPWDGGVRAGEFGWSIAPRFGFFLDMLSLWMLPTVFAGTLGTIGGALGMAAMFGSLVEAAAQLFLPEPYKMPLSRALIDWIPAE